MRLEEIDLNFKIETKVVDADIEWYDPRQAPFSLYGLSFDGTQYRRMPQAVANEVSDGIAYGCKDTAGGRVRFCTDSKVVSLFIKSSGHPTMSHMPKSGKSGFDLYRRVEGQDREFYHCSFIPPYTDEKEYVLSHDRLDGQMAEYTLNFPLYDRVYEVYIGLKKGAKLKAASPYRFKKPVVYYGSSITQGGCACRPGNAYQAIITRDLNIDHINLGFSGSAKGEPEMAEYIASLEMEAFVCDYDHNASDADHLERTLYPLYEKVRKAHPEIPIIFISAPDALRNPVKYGPKRKVVQAAYEKAAAQGDQKVWFIPGEELFAGDHWDDCTVDGTHPNDLGFYRMAKRIGAELKKALELE